MVFGFGRGQTTPLLIINFVIYLSATCLVAWSLNRNINEQQLFGVNFMGDYITTFFLPMALIACMLGLASVYAGIRHICIWKAESLGVAITFSLIAWIFDFVAMGFAVKEVEVSGGYRPGKLKVIEAFVIVVAIFELLHFCLLHENSFGCDSTHPSFTNSNMYNGPSLYNQVGNPHMHHHHPRGSAPGLTHEHRTSPPC